MSKEEILQKAINSILDIDEEMAREALTDAKEEGISAVEMLQQGFSKGLTELGERFANGDVFLPELLFASEIMTIVTEAVDLELAEGEKNSDKKGVVVIGTVEGDVHDIGKSICVSMLKSKGFEVYDLGREVPAEDFVNKAIEVKADIIASSALLTTTMPEQQKIEECLEELGLKGTIKTMVGGAPVTFSWAERIGATAYSEDAIECCNKATELVQK